MDESDTVVQKLKDLEILLEEYEHRINLTVKPLKVELDITRDVLLKMSPLDINGYRWELSQYSLYLQKELNKQTSRYNWAETNLKRLLEKECDEYPGFKWEERQANAMNANSYAQQLHYLKVKAKAVIDRLSFLPNKIQMMDSVAKDIAFTKNHYDKREAVSHES